MNIREVAELFDVSTEELLKTIASEVYELDVEFSPDELPEEVLEYRKNTQEEPTDDPASKDVSSNGRSVPTTSRETNSLFRQLLDRGKMGLGLLLILVNVSDRRTQRIRSELRDLGGRVIQDTVNSARSITQNYLEEVQTEQAIEEDFSILPGVSSIYLSVTHRWLERQPFFDWKSNDMQNQPESSNGTSEF